MMSMMRTARQAPSKRTTRTGSSAPRKPMKAAPASPGGTSERSGLFLRRFLNRPGHHAGDYILIDVPATSGTEAEYDNIVFELADCHRRARLDFPLWDAEDRRNSLHKADVLVESMLRFREALAAAAAVAARRERNRRKNLG